MVKTVNRISVSDCNERIVENKWDSYATLVNRKFGGKNVGECEQVEKKLSIEPAVPAYRAKCIDIWCMQ